MIDGAVPSGECDERLMLFVVVLGVMLVLVLLFTPLLHLILFSGAFALAFKILVIVIQLLNSGFARRRSDLE